MSREPDSSIVKLVDCGLDFKRILFGFPARGDIYLQRVHTGPEADPGSY